MYTQCSHCKAIFRVTMKELTAAQGKLRCGECNDVFNAMETLSTKLPGQGATDSDRITFNTLNQQSRENEAVASQHQQAPLPGILTQTHRHKKGFNLKHPGKSIHSLWLIALISLLCLTLATQVWLTKDQLFENRDPEKIKMVSRKVFAHPGQKDALVITASIRNTASYPQPYPYLEATLMDNNRRVVALRRFRPEEYISNYQPGSLLKQDKLVDIRLKIMDPPGNRARRFQFDFL